MFSCLAFRWCLLEPEGSESSLMRSSSGSLSPKVKSVNSLRVDERFIKFKRLLLFPSVDCIIDMARLRSINFLARIIYN